MVKSEQNPARQHRVSMVVVMQADVRFFVHFLFDAPKEGNDYEKSKQFG
jgi:hypothetical protein